MCVSSLPLSCLALAMPWMWHCTFCSPHNTCLEKRGKVVAPALPTHFIYCFISHTRIYALVQQFGCSFCWQSGDCLGLNKAGNCCQVPWKFSWAWQYQANWGHADLAKSYQILQGSLKMLSVTDPYNSLFVNAQLGPCSQKKKSSHIFSVVTGDWVDFNSSQSCFSPWASLYFYWNLLGFVIDFNRIRLRSLSESLLLAASLISMWYIWKLSVIMLPLKWKIDKLLSLGACWVQIGYVRSQVNWHQVRLLLSSLCLIIKLKATCLVGVHLRLPGFAWI